MHSYNEAEIRRILKIDAKAIGIPSGAAEVFIERTLKAVKQTLKNKKIITDNDLERAIAKELKKYNADFAYVYENRDKII
ncbi:MAG: hypothetical protein Q4A70_01670 [Candidatus Saccharibacteria bacterium]|nr:hypothetical protein [Candidatus Saccharibacteria bacterium]